MKGVGFKEESSDMEVFKNQLGVVNRAQDRATREPIE